MLTNFFSPLSFVTVFGSGIRDPGWVKSGSGIRDKHPGSATLNLPLLNYWREDVSGCVGLPGPAYGQLSQLCGQISLPLLNY
jgi:hypothetical protein